MIWSKTFGKYPSHLRTVVLLLDLVVPAFSAIGLVCRPIRGGYPLRRQRNPPGADDLARRVIGRQLVGSIVADHDAVASEENERTPLERRIDAGGGAGFPEHDTLGSGEFDERVPRCPGRTYQPHK